MEELNKSLDFANLDEEGIKGLVTKLMDPAVAAKLAAPLQELGYEIVPIQKTEE